jgi:Holliday junction resolvasome RuvABC endonuclease subunit
MSVIELARTQWVVGIDPALTRTGVAIIERLGDNCRAETFIVATEASDDHSPAADYKRIRTITHRVNALIPHQGARLGLIEAPAYDAEPAGKAWQRAGLWWHLVGLFVANEIPFGTVTPLTLKKWVTGFGGSAKRPVEKRDIVAGMRAMWPGLPCTQSELRHHECEGLAMAQMCGQRLGWPLPVRAHHAKSLLVVKWPKLACFKGRV